MTRSHPVAVLVAAALVGIGGFAGSNLRYVFDLYAPSPLAATLLVNVLGCSVLGFFLYEGRYTGIISERTHLVLLTGFISSFTTYSTFVIDAIQSRPTIGIAYVLGTYGLGFAAVLVGRAGAHSLVREETGTVETAADADTRPDREGDG